MKVGHGGTLDKDATGVLVLGVASGCQKLTAMLSGPKTYTSTGRLGAATDTFDATGTVGIAVYTRHSFVQRLWCGGHGSTSHERR